MGDGNQETIGGILRTQLMILLLVLGLLWGLEIVDWALLGGALDNYGVHPRGGLLGILWAPFLHGGFLHLVANSGPLFVLGWLVMMRETWEFFLVAGVTGLSSGIGTWLIGRTGTVHIGASGVVFGLFGYLVAIGIFTRSLGGVLLSTLVVFLYGGIIWGVLPTQALRGISWEGHLFGFLGGVATAYAMARVQRRRTGGSDAS